MEEHATRVEAIRLARSPRDIALARALLVEYAQSLQIDLCFQGFEHELASLPGDYALPRGRLFLAGSSDTAFGCIALRPLDAESAGDGGTPAGRVEGPVAEVKRLYVQPPYRHQGWGQRLAHALLDEARAIGYCELRLDTFDWMTGARSLYSGLGFRASAPYYNNPLAGAVYMSLVL
jgi:putative acetyltransferase